MEGLATLWCNVSYYTEETQRDLHFLAIRSDPGRIVKYYGTRPNYYCSSYPYPGCHVCSALHIAIITICTAAFFFCYTFTAVSIDAVSIFYGHAITATFTTVIASIHASFSNAAVICAMFAFCWPQQLSVTFDRKIKRSDLNVVISRSRLSTCSLSNGFLFHLSLYRFRTGQRSDAASYCEPANSTKSQRIDRGIYPDKANISYSRCDS